MNNKGLNYTGPLVHEYFSIVTAAVLHGPWFEFRDAEELHIWRGSCKLYSRLNLTLFGSAVLMKKGYFIFELNFKEFNVVSKIYLLSNIDIHIDIHLELVLYSGQ